MENKEKVLMTLNGSEGFIKAVVEILENRGGEPLLRHLEKHNPWLKKDRELQRELVRASRQRDEIYRRILKQGYLNKIVYIKKHSFPSGERYLEPATLIKITGDRAYLKPKTVKGYWCRFTELMTDVHLSGWIRHEDGTYRRRVEPLETDPDKL